MTIHVGYRIRLTKDLDHGKGSSRPILAGATGRISCISRGTTFSTISVDWDEPHKYRNLYVDENVDEFVVERK